MKWLEQVIDHVVLYSYRRPEQTDEAIRRILTWNPNIKLFVSIDGLRTSANTEEGEWRAQTILLAEAWAESFSNVEVVVWNENEGLTRHCIRIFSRVFSQTNSLISLEEDNLVSTQGFEFLSGAFASSQHFGMATGYTSWNHSFTDAQSRYSYFPEQWAVSLTQGVFEEFLKSWNDKKIDKKLIQGTVRELFPRKPLFQNLVVEKWYRIFTASVQDPSYGDALFSYTAIKVGVPFKVPLINLVTDLGPNDSRGMHPRGLPETRNLHSFRRFTLNERDFCETCEKASTNISGLGLGQSFRYLVRRTAKALRSIA
jgi:hypothetical protein